MSRGFVKEDDQEEAPFIPPMAALPPGVINYVTPVGLQQLLRERELLEEELKSLTISDEKEQRHTRAVLTGKLNLLNDRIASARKLDPQDQPKDEVRFGAIVTYEIVNGKQAGKLQTFQIVGVDEANIKDRKIAFVAPIARVLTGKKKGEIAEFSLGREVQQLRITKIEY